MQVTRTSFASNSTGSPGADRESHRASTSVGKADGACKKLTARTDQEGHLVFRLTPHQQHQRYGAPAEPRRALQIG